MIYAWAVARDAKRSRIAVAAVERIKPCIVLGNDRVGSIGINLPNCKILWINDGQGDLGVESCLHVATVLLIVYKGGIVNANERRCEALWNSTDPRCNVSARMDSPFSQTMS